MKFTTDITARHITGFTLMELMTTLVVAGIIASLAVPSFNSLIVGQQVRNASFDLTSSLFLTRDEAIKRNANVKIMATSNNWKTGWQIFDNNNNVVQSQGTYANTAFTSNVTTSTGCATPCVVFNKAGRIDISSATTVTSDGKAPSFRLVGSSGTNNIVRCFTLDASGRVNTTEASC